MKFFVSSSRVFNFIAAIILVAMMMLTVTDVVGRYLFSAPILGATELSEVMILSMGALGLAWCAYKKEHIKITLLMNTFPKRLQSALNSFTLFLGFIMSGLIAWRTVLEGFAELNLNAQSNLLRVPLYPFYWLLAFGMAMLAIIIAFNVVEEATKAVKK